MAKRKTTRKKAKGCGCSGGLGTIVGKVPDGRLKREVAAGGHAYVVRKAGDPKTRACVKAYNLQQGSESTVGCFATADKARSTMERMRAESSASSSPLFTDFRVEKPAAAPAYTKKSAKCSEPVEAVRRAWLQTLVSSGVPSAAAAREVTKSVRKTSSGNVVVRAGDHIPPQSGDTDSASARRLWSKAEAMARKFACRPRMYFEPQDGSASIAWT
jgi:hypothetical protein